MASEDYSFLTLARRSFFGSSFRRPTSSIYSTSQASIDTILPEYTDHISAVSNHASTGSSHAHRTLTNSIGSESELPPSPETSPPPYSIIHPRYSIIDTPSTLAAGTHTSSRATSRNDDYIFTIRQGKPWCTLRITNGEQTIQGKPRVESYKPAIPRLWSSQPVRGLVELDLDASQTIQHIAIALKGRIITGSLDSGIHTFVHRQVTLWDAKASTYNPKGKFVGNHRFPFSFPFPSYVDVESATAILRPGTILPFLNPSSVMTPVPEDGDNENRTRVPFSRETSTFNQEFTPLPSVQDHVVSKSNDSRKPKSPRAYSFITSSAQPTKSLLQEAQNQGLPRAREFCPTPQTFLETGIPVSVTYELTMRMTYGRFRPDTKIKTNVSYLPSIFPPPASLKRQQSYATGIPLLGPSSDPEGWKALPTTTFYGELGGTDGKSVTVQCTLYIAKPMSYTRGSVIPCYLEFSCADETALIALITSMTPHVELVRRLRYHSPQGMEGASILGDDDNASQNILTPPDNNGMSSVVPLTVMGGTRKVGGLKTISHYVTEAIWWGLPGDAHQGTSLRLLEGEIHLAPDLQPSSSCTIFSIEYFVRMLPLRSNTFTPRTEPHSNDRSRNVDIPSQAVEIATLFSQEGPIPTASRKAPENTKIRPMKASESGA